MERIKSDTTDYGNNSEQFVNASYTIKLSCLPWEARNGLDNDTSFLTDEELCRVYQDMLEVLADKFATTPEELETKILLGGEYTEEENRAPSLYNEDAEALQILDRELLGELYPGEQYSFVIYI